MSKHFKAIIPLLGEGITLDDIDPKKGFIGAYSYDINRPSLDQHIFLLYIFITTGFSIDRDKRLKALPTFRSRRIVKIKGFSIACYTFGNNIPGVRSIIDDRWNVNDNDKLKIFKFWNFTDDDINQYMLHPIGNLFSETFEQIVVPEWDCPKEELNSSSFAVPKRNTKSLAARDEQSGFFFFSFVGYKPQ